MWYWAYKDAVSSTVIPDFLVFLNHSDYHLVQTLQTDPINLLPPLPIYWRLSTCSKVITNLFTEVTPCRFLYGHKSYMHFQNQICIKPNIYGLRETIPVRIPDGFIPEVSTCKSIASLAAPVS